LPCANREIPPRSNFRFSYGVFPRCALCPLLEVERAVRDMLGENPIPPIAIEIEYGPRLRALLRGELDKLDQEFEEDCEVPDFPPEGWGEPPDGEPPAPS
jgi:hypothetical protein